MRSLWNDVIPEPEKAPQLARDEFERTFAQLQRHTDALREEVEALVDNASADLLTERDMLKEQLKQLRDLVERKREQAMDERKSYTQYVDAKRAYQTQNKILTEMREALLQEKVDLSLPKSPIEIHEHAEANELPVGAWVESDMKSAAVTGAIWAIPGGIICMYLAFVFSSRREDDDYAYEYYFEEIDADQVPEALEVDLDERDRDPF